VGTVPGGGLEGGPHVGLLAEAAVELPDRGPRAGCQQEPGGLAAEDRDKDAVLHRLAFIDNVEQRGGMVVGGMETLRPAGGFGVVAGGEPDNSRYKPVRMLEADLPARGLHQRTKGP